MEVEEEEEERTKTEERQSESHDQSSERLQISDAPLGQGLPPPRRLPLHLSSSSSHSQQSSRPVPRLQAVRARCAHPPTHTYTNSLSLTHTRAHTLSHLQTQAHTHCILLMVVGLPSSAAAPALVTNHEEAQAADGAAQLPQLLQQEAQIGAETREARGSLAQGGGGHHSDPERASRAGENEAWSAVGDLCKFCFGFRRKNVSTFCKKYFPVSD